MVKQVIWQAAEGHRYGEQLQFVSQFPAYVTDTSPQEIAWWYRRQDEADYVKFYLDSDGISIEVIGDQIAAQRAMRTALPPLPQKAEATAYPEPHQSLYRRFGGIRPVLFLDAFEGLAWSILGQQITVHFAAHLKEAIAFHWGTVVRGSRTPLAVFPSPRQLAGATVEDLCSLKLSRQKAEALIAIARRIDQGAWDIHGVYQQSTEEAMEALPRFKGIGPWSAEYSLLRVFGHADVLPAADVGLRRAGARLAGRERVSELELREAAQIWRGCRSGFAFWLWLSNVASRARHEEQGL